VCNRLMSSGIPFGLIQLKVVGDRESVTVNAADPKPKNCTKGN
jgi:hypothetical protein